MNKLFKNNVNLAYYIANKYYNAYCKTSIYVELNDIIQEALFGLHQASTKYNPIRSSDFGNYASYFIKKRLYDYFNNIKQLNSVMIKFDCENLLDYYEHPSYDVNKLDVIIDLKNAIDKLSDREQEFIDKYFYRDKTYISIGEELGISKQRVAQVIDRAVGKLQEEIEHGR